MRCAKYCDVWIIVAARTAGELPSSPAPRRLLAAPPTVAELTIENDRRAVKHEREMAALMAKYETAKVRSPVALFRIAAGCAWKETPRSGLWRMTHRALECAVAA